MKKSIFMSIILSLFLFSNVNATPEDAATSAAQYFQTIENEGYLVRTLRKVDQDEKVKVKVEDTVYTCYHGKAKKGEEVLIDTILSEGHQYIIIASGDENIKDIDSYVYDAYKNTVAYDRSSEKQSIPKFDDLISSVETEQEKNNSLLAIGTEASVRPKWTGAFHIKLKIRDANEEGNWALLIASKKNEETSENTEEEVKEEETK